MSKTTEPPRTHFQPDNAFKVCKCSECGIVSACVPEFDFYVLVENEDSGILTCENCLLKPYRGNPVLIVKNGQITTEAGHQ